MVWATCWSAAFVVAPRAKPAFWSWSAICAARPGVVVPLSTVTVVWPRFTGVAVPPPVVAVGVFAAVVGFVAAVVELDESPPPNTCVTSRKIATAAIATPPTISAMVRPRPLPLPASAPRATIHADPTGEVSR